jgi:hypothetical protein
MGGQRCVYHSDKSLNAPMFQAVSMPEAVVDQYPCHWVRTQCPGIIALDQNANPVHD